MSELLFLGTGAADWNIKDRAGFFRRNSAAMINRNLLIDCGRHIFDFAACDGTPDLYDEISDILITHSHGDHFCRESVLRLAEKQKIRIGCSAAVRETIGEHDNITYVPLTFYEEADMGEYRVMPLRANHMMMDVKDCAAHYIIKTPDDKTLFYGLDGAWFLSPSWAMMKRHRFDAMVFDCTVGDMDDWRLFEHNTIPMLRMMIKEIRHRGW